MGIIELTTNHTGKMLGIKSLSTSVLLNPNCQKNRKIKGSICSHCYAESLAKMYTDLGARLERNTKELTTRFLGRDDFAYLSKELKDETIFRFESFGDLNNEQQLWNYVHICNSFPNTRFALYTKQYELVSEFFKTRECPDNMNLIISSLKMNTPISSLFLTTLPGFKPGQVKVFTVYNKEFIKSHPELKINCGARSCNTCRLCYLENKVEHINEILKSDRESAEIFLKFNDPEKREIILENVEAILAKY